MTDHLPDCYRTNTMGPCICPALRACEARVREEYESQDCYALGFSHGINEGVPKALDAARDAVAAVFDGAHRLMSDGHYSYIVPDKADALAAIDALRGDA